MNESLHLGVIRGIRVGINWSLLPIFMLIVWSLAQTSLPYAAPGYSMWGYWVFAALAAAAFYASLLAHELAHALVARRRGVDVSGIVLWLFGGVAQLEGDTPDPRAELEVAAAGPATSLGLAAAGVAAGWLLAHVGASSLLVSSVQWLALVNSLLALFNLLPAFPLDGGRILRALLWRHWRDPVRATEVAAKLGRVIGFAMIAVGIVEFLAGGGAFGALWLTLIGWFITVAADQQRERVSQQSRVAGLRVADAMSRHPLVVPAKATVGEVIEHYVRPSWFASFPVADADGRIVGLATVQRMAKLPRESWRETPIAAAATARGEIVECSPGDRLADVTVRMQDSPDRRAIVLEGGRIVGIVTPSDARRAISHAELLGQPLGAPHPEPARREPGEAAGGIAGPVQQS